MKSKVFAFLAALLILVTSISVVGCGPNDPAEFQLSDLTMSPGSTVDVGTAVTISANVSNLGGTSGNHTVTCTVNGTSIGSQSVELAAKASQTVTFSYTPSKEGTFPVAIGNLSNTITATTIGGYWEIIYKVVNGSKVVFNYSLAGIGGIQKSADILPGQATIIMRVNRSAVNGARDVILTSSGWQIPGIFVKGVSPGVDMNVTMALQSDAKGILYVKDGIGDVDMSSVSSLTTTPKQVNKQGDGTKDPAGSLLIDTILVGHAYMIQVGKTVNLPFGLTFTTGNIINTVNLPKSKFNGAILTSTGLAFAKDGALKKADYVGTAGTITTTGTGDCIGITLVNFPVDFQAEIKLVLEPESVK